MTTIRYPEWRASLATTQYPFSDNATLSNATGDFLPDDAFADASLYVIGAKAPLYIGKVTLAADTCTFYVYDATKTVVALGFFDLLDPPDIVRLLDIYGRPAGALIAGDGLTIFRSWTVGEHLFEPAQTEFAVTVVVPTPEIGLRGFLLDDGSLLTGDVWLVGEDGVVLTYALAIVEGRCGDAVEYPVIRVDIVGDPLYRRTLCEPIDLFSTPRFLQKLRLKRGCDVVDLVPDAGGDIKITVGSHQASDTSLRVRAVPTGLKIEIAGSPLLE